MSYALIITRKKTKRIWAWLIRKNARNITLFVPRNLWIGCWKNGWLTASNLLTAASPFCQPTRRYSKMWKSSLVFIICMSKQHKKLKPRLNYLLKRWIRGIRKQKSSLIRMSSNQKNKMTSLRNACPKGKRRLQKNSRRINQKNRKKYNQKMYTFTMKWFIIWKYVLIKTPHFYALNVHPCLTIRQSNPKGWPRQNWKSILKTTVLTCWWHATVAMMVPSNDVTSKNSTITPRQNASRFSRKKLNFKKETSSEKRNRSQLWLRDLSFAEPKILVALFQIRLLCLMTMNQTTTISGTNAGKLSRRFNSREICFAGIGETSLSEDSMFGMVGVLICSDTTGI